MMTAGAVFVISGRRTGRRALLEAELGRIQGLELETTAELRRRREYLLEAEEKGVDVTALEAEEALHLRQLEYDLGAVDRGVS